MAKAFCKVSLTSARYVRFALAAGLMLTAIQSPSLAQGLFFDQDHDVIVLPKCAMAVRYTSKTFVPVKATASEEHGLFFDSPVLKSLRIKEDYSNVSVAQSPEQIFIECYDSGKVGTVSTNRFSKEFLKNNRIKEITMTSERISRETGLPLNAVQSVTAVKSFQVIPKGAEGPYNLFAFQHDKGLTLYARHMRGGRSDIISDPPVILTDLQFGSVDNCKGNVEPNAVADTARASDAGRQSPSQSR